MSKYVVVDLEMCNVSKWVRKETYNYGSEIIQIGAVLLDDTYKITDSFKTYVSPQFGAIDSFIQNLTGITKEDTKDAPALCEALEMFAEWIPDDAILVSWSDNDENQIRKELEHKHMSIPEFQRYMEGWIDCQKTFSEKMDSPKTYSLSEALVIADISFEDGAHDALVDAHNTALLFGKMQTEETLNLNAYYKPENAEKEFLSATLADLLKDFKFVS